jgi:hypothetical protein
MLQKIKFLILSTIVNEIDQKILAGWDLECRKKRSAFLATKVIMITKFFGNFFKPGGSECMIPKEIRTEIRFQTSESKTSQNSGQSEIVFT